MGSRVDKAWQPLRRTPRVGAPRDAGFRITLGLAILCENNRIGIEGAATMNDVRDEASADAPNLEGVKARDDVVSRQVDDEWVLYDPVSEKMHVLNVTASLVWNQLDGTQTLDELAALTREAFEQPPAVEVVARDVRAVLQQFASEGLLA